MNPSVPSPSEDAFNPFLPSFQEDPVRAFRVLLETDPVHYSPALKGWVVTRYRDVEQLLTDRTRFKKVGIGEQKSDNPIRVAMEEGFKYSLATSDVASHARQRKLLSKAFTPQAIERLRGFTQQFTDQIIDDALLRGEMDISRDLARRLPMAVICRMLGVPAVDEENFSQWSSALILLAANPTMSDEQFMAILPDLGNLAMYTTGLVEERRGTLGDDLLSAMILAEEQGDMLSSQELMANTMGLIAAGTETSTHAISHSVLDLLDHPEELARLRDDPSLLPTAIEELLRHIPFGMFGTVMTTTEVDLGGKRIPPGQVLFFSNCATNRDPSIFPDPDRLNLTRQDGRHLTFGHGPRYCLGAALARMELQVAIGTLLRRLPGLRLRGDRRDVRIEFNMLFRGIPSLPVTW